MTSLVFGEAATAAKGTTPYYTKSPIPPAKNVGCNQRFYIENVPELPLLPGATDHKPLIPSLARTFLVDGHLIVMIVVVVLVVFTTFVEQSD